MKTPDYINRMLSGDNRGGGDVNVNSVSCSTVAWKFQLAASLWLETRGVWML